ncbi:MAG: acyltransferase [Colwellia sp.]|nr:acyltransferase [Colwellia sp.]
MQYRREIDGLRAIAVLPVILFHAGYFGFSGGYIGVDIFFVISGYLITTIIIDELAQGNFSIKNFYERRAKRILPALSAVLVITTVLAFIFMPANLLKSYANSLMSVVTFTSNFHFFSTSGYFSTVSDQKPLLHTWSLAVEEQFYLFFPLMLGYWWVKGKKYIIKVVTFLSIISLLLAQFLAVNSFADANFYLIFSRAWELFAGALIALTSIQSTTLKKWQQEWLGIIGLILIFYSIFFFDEHTLFPSFYALVPIVGTVLIISFSTSQTLVGKFLSHRAFVSIGLISYSLYLWHQPLFAFLRLKSVGEPSVELFVLAIILSFILAILSYHFVEKPFRRKPSTTIKARFSVLQYAGMSIAFFIIVGLISVSNRGFQSRFGDNSYMTSIKFSPKRKACHYNGRNFESPENSCRYFGKNVTWATFGDSHTVEPAYALAKALEPKEIGLLHLSFSNCAPSLLFEVKDPGCTKWVKGAFEYLENNKSIKNVYLGFHYSGFLFGSHRNHYPELPDNDPNLLLTSDYSHLSAQQTRELYWQGLSSMINRLIRSGKTVYLQYPIPELPLNISNLLTPFSVFGGDLRFDLQKTTSMDYYFTRNSYILEKLNSLTYNDKLIAIKPFELMCSLKGCPAVSKGKSLYFDDGHLSVFGATQLLTKSQIVN